MENITIILTAKEKYSHTISTINSLIKNTKLSYKLIVILYNPPEYLQNILKNYKNIEIIITNNLYSQENRYNYISKIKTKYTVFIENTILFKANWLENLVLCAEETDAGIVGPLYLNLDNTIKMFGGKLIRKYDVISSKDFISENYELKDVLFKNITNLERKECDFVEYDCLLIKSVLLKDNIIDSYLKIIYQNIDLSMTIKSKNYKTYVEPKSIILCNTDNFNYDLYDINFYCNIWSIEKAQQDLVYFCNKWDLVNTCLSFRNIKYLIDDSNENINYLFKLNHRKSIVIDSVSKSLDELIDKAKLNNYNIKEINMIKESYLMAEKLFKDQFRQRLRDRKYITHLTGTAGILIDYNFNINIICAGLLHSCYNINEFNKSDIFKKLILINPDINKIINLYSSFIRNEDMKEILELNYLDIFKIIVILIALINELEMYISGEYKLENDKTWKLNKNMLNLSKQICDHLDISSLYNSLELIKNKV
jgi:hypothetical protein